MKSRVRTDWIQLVKGLERDWLTWTCFLSLQNSKQIRILRELSQTSHCCTDWSWLFSSCPLCTLQMFLQMQHFIMTPTLLLNVVESYWNRPNLCNRSHFDILNTGPPVPALTVVLIHPRFAFSLCQWFTLPPLVICASGMMFKCQPRWVTSLKTNQNNALLISCVASWVK